MCVRTAESEQAGQEHLPVRVYYIMCKYVYISYYVAMWSSRVLLFFLLLFGFVKSSLLSKSCVCVVGSRCVDGWVW